MSLVEYTESGFYVPKANVYIDPWKPVKRALITHAHSDHARKGHLHYLCHKDSEGILRFRLGEMLQVQTAVYGEKIHINGVNFSFHPAGHIPGSSQIRIEYQGDVWVVSGDYQTGKSHFIEPFEPVKCRVFITESTFGLPIFKWEKHEVLMEEISAWWRKCHSQGLHAIIGAYSLGKAQRLIHGLHDKIPNIYCHSSIAQTNRVLAIQGFNIGKWKEIPQKMEKKDFLGALIIVPPSVLHSGKSEKWGPAEYAFASGWMSIRGMRRRQGLDRGFEVSDHADWDGLLNAIADTGAERVDVTHGYQSFFSKDLRDEKGLDSREVNTSFGEEEE